MLRIGLGAHIFAPLNSRFGTGDSHFAQRSGMRIGVNLSRRGFEEDEVWNWYSEI
jgi:hypothetical protein